MKRHIILILSVLSLISFSGCKNHAANKLKRQVKPLAKEYLKNDHITDYDSLNIECVDTVTELSYAKLNSELLANMATAYEAQYEQALQERHDKDLHYLELYINEINRTKNDFDELMESGSLKADGILLFMVTGNYVQNGEHIPFMFMVNPDKKTLHTLDPFGDNLLYKDEQ